MDRNVNKDQEAVIKETQEKMVTVRAVNTETIEVMTIATATATETLTTEIPITEAGVPVIQEETQAEKLVVITILRPTRETQDKTDKMIGAREAMEESTNNGNVITKITDGRDKLKAGAATKMTKDASMVTPRTGRVH